MKKKKKNKISIHVIHTAYFVYTGTYMLTSRWGKENIWTRKRVASLKLFCYGIGILATYVFRNWCMHFTLYFLFWCCVPKSVCLRVAIVVSHSMNSCIGLKFYFIFLLFFRFFSHSNSFILIFTIFFPHSCVVFFIFIESLQLFGMKTKYKYLFFYFRFVASEWHPLKSTNIYIESIETID